eukprot:GFUD01044037.1.p1 GENE.GFUD01044037.1~~GFUD01044037.1.p1  ORF type:complete len:336 (+),score=103.52 GFUD01044037.1:120-1127(+)
MPPLYNGSADEWNYLSSCKTSSSMSFEFIIDNFEDRMKNPKSNYLKSRQFTVKDSLWHVEVLPNNDKEGYKDNVGVFIHNDNQQEFTVTCKFKVGSLTEKFENKKMGVKIEWGFRKFASHQKCKEELLQNGNLELKVDIEVLGEEEDTLFCGKGKNFGLNPDTNVSMKLFEEKILTDYNVVCNNGMSFPCHKAFLAARSPVFRAMIESEMKEAKEATIHLVKFSAIVVENLVKYVYTGQVDEEVLKDNADNFLDLGEQFDIAELKAMAEQSMITNLDKENMVNYFLAGELYNGVKIRAAAKAFLRQNMKSLVKQDGWKEALKERDLVFELLESFT